jgi:hypothetical protein
VKTVISVDGARPDVEGARRYGLRYVHLPMGYDGVRREQTLHLARAVRDLPGAFYVHCHHGQHRGPTAAAVARLCLDPSCSVEAAVETMRRAGADRHYTGLYDAVRRFRRPAVRELNEVSGEFPEVAPVAALAQVMAAVDGRWDTIKRLRAVGWHAPKDNPDVEPAHEALQLREMFREAARLAEVRERPADFQQRLTDAVAQCGRLEESLRKLAGGQSGQPAAVEAAFRQVGTTCNRCHEKYRDTPEARK